MRRIRRAVDSCGQRKEAADDRHQNISSDGRDQKTLPKPMITFKDLDHSLPRFGPCFGEDKDNIKHMKKDAWSHIIEKSKDKEPSSLLADYLVAIQNIEERAKEMYDSDGVMPLDEFRQMMVRDGCFFLQLAMIILGGFEQLGYLEHYNCSFEPDEDKKKDWIKAMFFVGNQIPCVVINKLLEQSFFKNVIEKGTETWKPPSDLYGLTLYLVVLQPILEKNCQKGRSYWKESPVDLLHALQALVLGFSNNPLDPLYCKDEDDVDLESGMEDYLNLKIGFPSATKIKESGIRIRKANWGIRGVHFRKKYLFLGYLYVPPLEFDMSTEPILRCLRSYEKVQQMGKSNREVTAYLQFMTDLVQTPRDMLILESKGILSFKSDSDENTDKWRCMRKSIVSSEKVPFTRNLRLTMAKVDEYKRPPFYLISWMLIFTVVQALFTVLQYFKHN